MYIYKYVYIYAYIYICMHHPDPLSLDPLSDTLIFDTA